MSVHEEQGRRNGKKVKKKEETFLKFLKEQKYLSKISSEGSPFPGARPVNSAAAGVTGWPFLIA